MKKVMSKGLTEGKYGESSLDKATKLAATININVKDVIIPIKTVNPL